MTMKERIARAIFESMYPGSPWPQYPQSLIFVAAADDVLKAMREPTEAMLFAADWQENGTLDAWRAMIDEALK